MHADQRWACSMLQTQEKSKNAAEKGIMQNMRTISARKDGEAEGWLCQGWLWMTWKD